MDLETILLSNENEGLPKTSVIVTYKIYTDEDKHLSRATFTDFKKALEYIKVFLPNEKAYLVRETHQIISV